MTISAFVSDLDGTMWSKDLEVHDETRAFIDCLDRAGVPLLIATGRRAKSALHGLRLTKFADRPGVLMNGALARDELVGPSFLVESIPPTAAASVLATFLESGLEPIIYVDHPEVDMAVGRSPAASMEYIVKADGVRLDADLELVVRTDAVIGFGAFGYSRSLLDDLAREIVDGGWASAIVAESMFEGDHGIMIQGAGIDKITGIRAWCARHDISPDNLAVIGDGANDIGMLDAAAIAIVPETAPEAMHAHAHHLIPSPDAGGWSALRRIVEL